MKNNSFQSKRVFIHGRILSLMACIFILSLNTQAARFYVDATKPNNSGNGLSWLNAKKDIQDAIQLALAGDEVWVKSGTYIPNRDAYGSLTPADIKTKCFYMKSGVKVYGGFNGSETLLSQRNATLNTCILEGRLGTGLGSVYHLVVSVNDNVNTLLDGFTIQYAYAGANTSYTIESELIVNNRGGGVYIARNNQFSLMNCLITNNGASIRGGGVYARLNSTGSISNCIILKNNAFEGGGMFLMNGANMTIQNTTIFEGICVGSGSSGHGGGCHILTSSPTFTNVTVDNCTANVGGGIYCTSNSHPVITQCNFNLNMANDGGGLYCNYDCRPVISQTKFHLNIADYDGGAVYALSTSTSTTPLKLMNCILDSNISMDQGGAFYFAGVGNPLISGCGLIENFGNTAGAAYLQGQNAATFQNCVMVKNQGGTGAVLVADNSQGALQNCTVVDNNSTVSVPYLLAMSGANLSLSNSIVWNTAGTTPQIIQANSGGSILANTCNIQGGYAGTAITNVNPVFVAAFDADGADNVFGNADDGLVLSTGSACINAGNNSLIVGIPTDITGQPRLQGIAVDLGAYEGAGSLPQCSVLFDGFDNPSSWIHPVSAGTCATYYNELDIYSSQFIFDAIGGHTNYMYRTGLNISDGCFKADFDFTPYMVGQYGGVGHRLFALASGTQPLIHDDQSSTCSSAGPCTFPTMYCQFSAQKGIEIQYASNSPYSPTSYSFDVRMNNGLGGYNFPITLASIPTTNLAGTGTYYFSLERTSATTGSLSIFTNAARTIHYPGSPVSFTLPASFGGLNTAQIGVEEGGHFENFLYAALDNLCIHTPCSNPCTLNVSTLGAGCGTVACPYQCSGLPVGGTFSGPAGLNAITGQYIGSIPASGIPYTYTYTQGTCTYTANGMISKSNTAPPPTLSTYMGPSASGPQLIVTWPCTGYTCDEWYQYKIQTATGGSVSGCTSPYTQTAPSAIFPLPYTPLVNSYVAGSSMPVTGTCGKVLANCTSLVSGQSYCVTWRIIRCGVTGPWSTCFVTPAQRPAGEEETIEEFIQNQVYPNPASSEINIQFQLEQESAIALEVFDMQGRRIDKRAFVLDLGEHHLKLNSSGYANGLYMVRISTSEKMILQEKIKVSH